MQDNTDPTIQLISSWLWKQILVGQVLQYSEGNPQFIAITVYMKMCMMHVIMH